MGKVKSVIITSLLVIAILVAAFFGVASFNVSNTQRLNSIASSIHLGGEFSGYAYTTLYPEGVISAQDHKFLDEDEAADYVAVGGVYVDGTVDVEALKASVASDAEKISQRFSQRGLSSYSVSVEDGVTVKVSVPTNYSYAAYKSYNTDARAEALTSATNVIVGLTSAGKLSLRTTDASISAADGTVTSAVKDDYTDELTVNGSPTYSLTTYTEDVDSFFKSITNFSVGATHVINFDLTEHGRERMKSISNYVANSSSQQMYVFIGETQVLPVSFTTAIDSDVMQFTTEDGEAAHNSAIVLDSAVHGGALELTYEALGNVFSSVAASGENAALLAAIACLVIIAAVIVAAIVKYKKLGMVVGLNVLVYALVILYALFLLEVQVTYAVLVAAIFGLLLFAGTNAFVFEEVRSQCKTGKTLQSALKAAYKRTAWPAVDVHFVLFVIAIFLTFVAVGEVAAVGQLLIIATLASYVLYWFTRFMWYVTSSSAKDKFGFGGFKREVYGDD